MVNIGHFADFKFAAIIARLSIKSDNIDKKAIIARLSIKSNNIDKKAIIARLSLYRKIIAFDVFKIREVFYCVIGGSDIYRPGLSRASFKFHSISRSHSSVLKI